MTKAIIIEAIEYIETVEIGNAIEWGCGPEEEIEFPPLYYRLIETLNGL